MSDKLTKQDLKSLIAKNIMNDKGVLKITAKYFSRFLDILLLKANPKKAVIDAATVEIKDQYIRSELKHLADEIFRTQLDIDSLLSKQSYDVKDIIKKMVLDSKPVLRFLFNISHGWIYKTISTTLSIIAVITLIAMYSKTKTPEWVKVLENISAFLFFIFIILSVTRIFVRHLINRYISNIAKAAKTDKKVKIALVKYIFDHYKPELKSELKKSARIYKTLLRRTLKLLASDSVKISKDFDIEKVTQFANPEEVISNVNRVKALVKQLNRRLGLE